MKKSKWIPAVTGLVFVLLAISLALPRFKDKEKTPADTLPVIAVTEPVSQAPVEKESREVEESSEITTAAVVENMTETKAAARTQTTVPPSSRPFVSSTVAGQWEWQTARYYVDRLGRVITIPESAAVLQYAYDAAEDFYYTNFTVPAGTLYYTYKYNIAPLTTKYSDSLDVRFRYGGKAWLIRLVKGQYAWLYVGGETQVFCNGAAFADDTGGSDALYSIPPADECPDITLNMAWKPNESEALTFSRKSRSAWLCDGYVFGILNDNASPIRELVMTSEIVFPDEKMAALFAEKLTELNFRTVKAAESLQADSFCRKGNAVRICWRSVTTQNNS